MGDKMFRKSMRILIIMLCCLICISYFPMNHISLASGNIFNITLPKDVINWDTALDVPTKKDWTIIFNQPVDDNYVNQNYFFVVNSANKLHPINIFLSMDKKEVLIQPEKEYLLGETYRFYIMNGIKSQDGKLLDKAIRMYFIIQNDSEVVTPTYSEFYAMVSDVFGASIRLVRINNIKEDYVATYNTEFIGKQLRDLNKGDLVKIKVTEDEINRLEYIDKNPKNITSINKYTIELGEKSFDILKDTFIYVVNKDIKAMPISEFINMYDTSKSMTGYVVESVKDSKIADIIVITDATYNDNMLKAIIGKVTSVRMVNNNYDLTIMNSAGESSNHRVVANSDSIELIKNRSITIGSIVELKVVNDDSQDIVSITEMLDEINEPLYKVISIGLNSIRNERSIILQDRNGKDRTIWLSRAAIVFGYYKIGSLVAIGEIDQYDSINLLDVRVGDEATGIWP